MKFDWTSSRDCAFELVTPIKLPQGEGKYHIRIVRRPHYCDRGDWMIYVDGEGYHDLDFADGFPRYFFGDEEDVKRQMETWLLRREAFRNALDAWARGTTPG